MPDITVSTADIHKSTEYPTRITNIAVSPKKAREMRYSISITAIIDTIWLTVLSLPHIFAAITLPPLAATNRTDIIAN